MADIDWEQGEIVPPKESRSVEVDWDRGQIEFPDDLKQGTSNNKRTWSEFGKDVALSAVQGLDTLAKLPAMAYDKATTGNWYGPETLKISAMSDERESLKSAESQEKNKAKEEVARAAGEAANEYVGGGTLGTAAQVASEFGVSFWESMKDPASIPEFAAQQAAQLGVMGKVGKGSEIAAHTAAKAAPRLAATKAGQAVLANSGTAGAVGFGATLQGVDVGSDTMQRLMALPDEKWAQNPDYLTLAAKVGPESAKQEIAAQLAGEATLKAGAVSLATAAMPGGASIERALVGKHKGGIGAVPRAFAGEAAQEGAEEGSGKYFSNTSVKEINPQQDSFEGVGSAAGQGAYMGGVMGGGIHAARSVMDNGARLPDTGPMSRAANKAMDSGAVNAADVLGVPAQEQSPAGDMGSAIADSGQPFDAGVQALADVQRQPATLAGPDRVREIETRLSELQAIAPASPEVAALAGERDQITAAWPQSLGGAPTSFSTESGARLNARYALMDASQLVTSHDEQLRPSPSYPKELQPRERDRAASEMQISGIAQRLDPARLGESADSATGAPIVGADGLVESGNARSIALKRVYSGNPEKAAAYRLFLQDNAQHFGLDPQAVSGMQNPVLVRVRETPVDRVEFARQANASTVAQMSPSEQARSDAGRLDTLDDLQPTEDGDFMSSRDFVRRFVGRLPGTEQAGMMDASGQLSQAGYTRIRNAILAKAYGDSPVLTRMVESLDDNLRNVGKALMRAAPDVAKMRADIGDGALFEADITPDLLAGVETLSRLKDEGRSISEALAQADMLGGGLSPEAGQLLSFMDENIRRPRRIAEFIQRYTDALRASGNPNQGSLLGETKAPSKRDIINAAWNRENESTGQSEQQEYGQPPGNSGTGQKVAEQRDGTQSARVGAQGSNAAGQPNETPLNFSKTEVENSRGKKVSGFVAEFDNRKGGKGYIELAQDGDRIYPAMVDNGIFKPGESTGGAVSMAYEQAIEFASKQGKQFTSDDSVTVSAAHVYDGLARRGYQVVKNPSARLATPPEVITDRWVTDDGTPVFTVQRKPESKEWVIFPPETGTLGIPRAEMPQVKGEHRGALISFLKGQGIKYTTHSVPAEELKPTQAEFSIKKAARWGEIRDGADRSVLVSSDGFILDGHHQWVAALSSGDSVQAIQFDAPINKLLVEVHQFPSVQRSDGVAGNDQRNKAREDFKDALADLGAILRDFAPVARMVPEKTPNLMPTLVRLFKAGLVEVGYNIKELVAYVKKQLKAKPETKAVWNKISDDIYRKAARQAIDEALSEPRQAPLQRDLFAASEAATPIAGQGDLFASQPAGNPAQEPTKPAPKKKMMVIDGVEYDADAPNFGMPAAPLTLKDGDPLLVKTDEKPVDSMVIYRGGEMTRDEMHLAIEEYHFRNAVPAPQDRKPIAYVMGGGGASGKGTIKRHLRAEGIVDGANTVGLDPDEIKEDHIPEYQRIIDAGDSRAAEIVHEESSALAKRIKAKAIAGRFDMVLDVTLGDMAKGIKTLQELKDAGYEVRLFGVTIKPETAVIRAGLRAESSKRYVPYDVLLHAHKGFAGAWETYAEMADVAMLYENTDGRQKLAEKVGGKLVLHDEQAYNEFAERRNINESAESLGKIGSLGEGRAGIARQDRRQEANAGGTPGAGSSGRRDQEGERGSSPRLGSQSGEGKSGQKGSLNDQPAQSGARRTEGQKPGPVQGSADSGRVERVSGREGGRDSGRDSQQGTGDRVGAGLQQAAADQPSGSGRRNENGQRNGPRGNPRRTAGVPAARDIPAKTGRNYAFSDTDLTYEGSWLVKARQNVEALELLKQLEKEGRQASKEEQAKLAKFIGWGASDLANSLFGDKLDKQLESLGQYDQAMDYMERGGKGYLANRDAGFYQAFMVVNAKEGGGLQYYSVDRITKERLSKAKPDAAARKWAELRDRIKAALTPEEWKEASRSTQYAHYTSKQVVKAMWDTLERMGFKGGSIIEPGAGIGVFPGIMSSAMANSSIYTGIEFDSVTGGILKQLFPDERIRVESFVDSQLPKNFYDVAAGNPPFNNTAILADPAYKKHAFALHDYFFAKTIDSVKPGGLVMFVTSRYTMDKLNDKARAYLAERADLVGAIRLPQTAFKKNAGTDVVTDVLFLRKKVEGEAFEHAQPWAKSVPMKVGKKSFPVNEYFHAHPEMVLGTPSDKGKMANSPEPQYTVEAIEGDIDALFTKAAATLPANIYQAERGGAAEAAAVREIDFNPKAQKEGNFYVSDDGKLMQREGGVGVLADEGHQKNAAVLKDFVSLRDALKQAQYDQLNDGEWEASLAALQKAYAAFVKKHGQVNQFTEMKRIVKATNPETGETFDDERSYKRFPLLNKIDADPDYTVVMALEAINEETGAITESAFLTDRVLGKPLGQEIKTPADALLAVLNDLGHVDIDAVADRMGMDRLETIDALGSMVYEDPAAGWVMADEYLSGNVKKKLQAAQEAAKNDRLFERNIDALLAVQPVPVPPADITVSIGMNWIPSELYEQFLAEKTGIKAKVIYNERTGQWAVDAQSATSTLAATQEWGTPRRSADDILLAALSGAPIRVTETAKESGGGTKTIFLADATEAANQKLAQMREAFQDWIWQDGTRTDKLVALYNDTFNTIVPRAFDGRHLTLPGTSKKWKVFDHVKRGAWRIIQAGNTYLAHAVGSGKTFEMIISAMEQKRLGLIKKPMMVVPNHMLQQFSREWVDLYPAARLMVADEKNFHTENRRKFISRVALSDLDGVIITHSAFKLLDLDPAFKQKMIEQELDYLRAAFDEAGGEEGKKSRDPKIKQIESKIEKMEQKLEAAMSGAGKDKNVRFDEMGVDFVYVDEAHEFRKLAFTTQRQVKGIDSSGSDRAFDLWMKTRWLEEKKPGRSLVMASGTPVTNTLAELYSVQRFMAPAVLEERGLDEFDAWASMFGQEHTEIEADASGKYAPVTRFSKFVNVPELTQMFREFADVLTSDHLAAMLGDKRPKVKDGSRKIVITPQTNDYRVFKQELAERLAESRAWKPTKDEPNNPDPVIRIIGDGRLAAIDMRFIDPSLPSDPDSKLNRMADEVIRVFKETADFEYNDKAGKVEPNKGATQIVFSDLGFGAGVAENRGFSARAWFEKRLRDAGVPPSQVAFMSDHKKSTAKLKLFKDINAGRVRIVVGSSKNMGTGVNAQQRLIALHHLDTPWYPADLEQREGRIVRQGNKNPQVQLYAYSTKGSYDAVMWQMLASKQRFIDQALSGDSSVRSIDDLSESSQFQIATAMTSDDERAIQLAGLRAEIEKLQRLYRAHEEQRAKMRQDYDWAGETIRINERKLPEAQQAADRIQDLSGDNFKAKANGRAFDTRKEFGEALIGRFKAFSDKLSEAPVKLGEISGFNIMAMGRTGQGSGYEAGVFLDLPEPVLLTEAATADPVGVALKATNALAGLGRQPAQMQQRIEEAKAKRNALEARITAPFPMAEMLADKIKEAQDLEAAMLADQNKMTGIEREQQLEDLWQQKTGAITPLFSRGSGVGMAVRDLSAVATRVSKHLKNLPKVHVLESPAGLSTKDPAQKALRDFILKAGAWDDVEGATHEGEIFLFASGLADEARAEHVLAVHEVTHYGLRGAVEEKRLDAALQEIWAANAKVRKAAAALKERFGLESNVEATEEVLADMRPGELVKLMGWRRVVKVIRDWLSRVGFERLAARFDAWMKAGMTDQEKADVMVADLVTAAREWVRSGKGRPYMGGTRLADGSLADDLAKQEKWLTIEAKARGFKTIDEMAEKNYQAFENLAKLWREKHQVDGALLSRNKEGQGTVFSRNANAQTGSQSTAAQRADEIISKPATSWKPIDAVMRTLTTTVRLDRLTGFAYDKIGGLLDRWTPEEVKAGVVSDYGIPEAVIDQRTAMQGRMRVQLRKTGSLIDKLGTLTRAESRIAYEWMNNSDPQAAAYFEAQLPPESLKVMEEVKGMIDALSQEAVALGQLDPEAFKRNRFEYLRRSYIKHTTELTKAETSSRKRSIAIMGEQYKGRGMSDAVDMAKFKNVAPEWWGRKLKEGQADKGLKGERFIRLERRAPMGEGVMELAPAAGPGNTNPQTKGRLLEVIYWPVGESIPAKYSTWDHAGTWEVRDTKGGKLIVWRDFTKQERGAMGEIDEARYAMAKTLHGMIHDVETGRYLEWVGRTYGKKPGDLIDGDLVEASDRMRDVFKPGEWVQVPETKITGTSVLKYGKLAGRIIPGPIWNDVRQTVGFRFKPLGETYAAILGAWKTAKTALSPAVHTNNIMANMVMADWHDVGAGHVLKALRIILGASQRQGKGVIGRTGNALSRAGIVDAEAAREILQRYGDSGANLGSWVTAELQREQLEPLLEALEKEIGLAGQTVAGEIGVMAALLKASQLRFPSAWDAFKPTLPGRAITTEARSMIDLYEAEDQVFRLAAWLKAKEDGASDLVAGKIARRSFLDYNINAPWVQALRNTVLPFISFTYRAVPMLLETAARKPHKLMKLGLVAGAINALGYMLSGGDEDDERALLPEEKAGSIFGMVPKLIRMPWNSEMIKDGQSVGEAPVFLDIRRFVPVGDIFDLGATHSAVPMLPFTVPGGPLALMSELVSNKSQFSGRAITLETDTAVEKFWKVTDHLYKAFAPNIIVLPGTHAWTGAVNASTGKTDSFGREQSVGQATASAFGVKLGSYPKDVLRLNAERAAQAKLMEIDRNITQLKRERLLNGIDDEEFRERFETQMAKKQGIVAEFQRRVSR
jgi:N12 class adenine-specific DNA methylase/predicted ABC-type ATPase